MQKIASFLLFMLVFIQNIFGLTEKQARDFFHLNPKHSVKFIDIKGYQQTTDYTCGPAAVMSLLHYYGELDCSQMNPKTEMQLAKEMGTTVAEGTNEQQIVKWLNDHGFHATLYYSGTVAKLRQNLAKGVPVLINWIDWGGHWVALAGYDAAGNIHSINHDTIFFADPAVHFDNIKTRDGISFFNSERFSYMWFNSKMLKNICIVARMSHGCSEAKIRNRSALGWKRPYLATFERKIYLKLLTY
jgi:predicted double-glycine peptidase